MAAPNGLGEYLRARRELMNPTDAGLRVTGVRRTPGLRREEVATLAGISADYYLRLEQGRDRHPSVQVLEALADVFGLDTAAREYLLSLTGTAPRASATRRRETVPVGVRLLLDSLPMPAFVESRTFDVLAVNRWAPALLPTLQVGENRLRSLLLDDAERCMHPNADRTCKTMVASLRTSIGTRTDDPDAVRLVGELSLASDLFRRLWARHDVSALTGGSFELRHPRAGVLHLRRQKFPIAESDGQILAIYHAEAGSQSEQRMVEIGAAAALAGATRNDGLPPTVAQS